MKRLDSQRTHKKSETKGQKQDPRFSCFTFLVSCLLHRFLCESHLLPLHYSLNFAKTTHKAMTPERQSVWEDDIFVRSYDVDSAGKLRLSSLFNYFQETAGKHATHLGAGYDVLRGLGLFWVLSRAKIRVHRLPAWGESVRLTTWPKGLDGVLFL